MPGTNHSVEHGFINQLPMLLREPAYDALYNYRLKPLIDMHQRGANGFLKLHYPQLTPAQWTEIMSAAILTKITYFQVDTSFPPSYIDKLFQIMRYAYPEPDASLIQIFQHAKRHYPFLASWIQQANDVRKTLLEQHLAQKK